MYTEQNNESRHSPWHHFAEMILAVFAYRQSPLALGSKRNKEVVGIWYRLSPIQFNPLKKQKQQTNEQANKQNKIIK